MKIGQAATATGISERMIRHYEKIGLIDAAPRRDSGYRDYDEADLRGLHFIRRARDLGFPIEEIRQLLALWHDRGRSSADVKLLAMSRAAELKQRVQDLEQMRAALMQLADSCAGDDRPDCPILGDLAALDIATQAVAQTAPAAPHAGHEQHTQPANPEPPHAPAPVPTASALPLHLSSNHI